MRSRKGSFWITSLVACGLLQVVAAQKDEPPGSTLESPIGREIKYILDTGLLDNPQGELRQVYATEIKIPDAVSIRLFFETVLLGKGSFIRVTSGLDNEVQELDAEGLEMWSQSTAFFNGDTLTLEIYAAPGTINQITMDRLWVDESHWNPAGGGSPCSECGTRTSSTQEWTGRLMPVGCTASVYTEDSCLVSAGHCIQSNLVIQFRVPPSQSNCNTVNPPVAEQFPIVNRQFQNAGVGNDWAVMTTGTNNLGQKPYQRYGVLRRLANALANVNDPATVTGYGVDGTCTVSQTQQTSSRFITGRFADYYTFNVEVQGGNSGSALIHNDEIIGIVTHCGSGCTNYATRVDDTAFVSGRRAVCNHPPVANNDSYPGTEDQTLVVNPPGVLSNDSDPDGNSLTAVRVTNPAHGTLTLASNGGFVYVPEPNFNGTDSFTYQASDGGLLSNTATVTLTLNAVNDVPVARNDSYSVDEDRTLTVDAPGVLANDTDVEGASLQAILVSNPTHGDVTLNTNGSFIYTPDANYQGTDTFTYRAREGEAGLQSNVATVTITIDPAQPGDVNGDGCVDDADLSAIVFAFGNTGSGLPEDLNGDGEVNDADLSEVIFHFGEGC